MSRIESPVRIQAFPILEDFKGYTVSALRADSMAGLNVALLALPQAMAYALVAGLPLSSGLLSAFIGTILAACCGSSKYLIIGPSNAIAILIQAATVDILYTHYRGAQGPEYQHLALEVLVQLSLLIGLMQVISAYLGLGRLVQFVSRSVVVGYINGAACTILVGQLLVLCAVGRPEGAQSVLAQAWHLCTQWGHYHPPTLLVGGISLFLLFFLRRLAARAFAAAIMLAVIGFVVFLSREHLHNLRYVGDFGLMTRVIPEFHVPYLQFSLLSDMLPHAFAIGLLGLLESSSAAKAVNVRGHQRICINQQIFGLGVSNIVAACIGAMPASGSASRSFLNYDSGARTRMAAVFSGIWTALIWAALGGVVVYIPLVALSAILILTAFNMIDWQQIKLCFCATGADATVLLVTSLAAVVMSLDVAFYTGVILSLTFYLREASTPRVLDHSMPVLGELLHLDMSHTERGTRVVELAGEFFFGSSEFLEASLLPIVEENETRVFVLRLRNVFSIDATACMTIDRLYSRIKSSGKRLLICDITSPVMAVLRDSGLADKFSEGELFTQDSVHPTKSLEKALASLKPGCPPSCVLT